MTPRTPNARPTDAEIAKVLREMTDRFHANIDDGEYYEEETDMANEAYAIADALEAASAEPLPVWDCENAEPGGYHDYAYYLPDANNIGGRIRITINDEDGSAWLSFLGTDEPGDEWCEGSIEIGKPQMAAQMVGHPFKAAGVEGR